MKQQQKIIITIDLFMFLLLFLLISFYSANHLLEIQQRSLEGCRVVIVHLGVRVKFLEKTPYCINGEITR